MHASGPKEQRVAWQAGGASITEAAIAREMQHHRANDPQRARDEAARALVVRELLRLESDRLGLTASVEPADGETHEEACVRVLLDREVPARPVDEAACRRYFDANVDRLREPDRARLRHILLAAAPDDLDGRLRARELGEQLIAELRETPERFAELAQRHSACPSREDGGNLGWVERGTTVPEFERQVLRLESGLARLTVESRWGHHVVVVDAVERGVPLDYARAAPRVAAWLETQARQHAIHDYLQSLAHRYGVQGVDASPAAPAQEPVPDSEQPTG